MGLLRDTDVAEIRDSAPADDLPGQAGSLYPGVEPGIRPRSPAVARGAYADFRQALTARPTTFCSTRRRSPNTPSTKFPATVIRNGKDYGIRFFGLPAGYEFAALLDAILAVSRGGFGIAARKPREAGPTHPAASPAGFYHPHLTPLPAGRAPGLPVRHRKRPCPRRWH